MEIDDQLQREVMLGPDFVARNATRFVRGKAVKWMLSQPREVRRSYVHEVMDRPADRPQEPAQQAWMLRQPGPVRASFVEQVLLKRDEAPSDNVLWMLAEPYATRDSYASNVLGIDPPG